MAKSAVMLSIPNSCWAILFSSTPPGQWRHLYKMFKFIIIKFHAVLYLAGIYEVEISFKVLDDFGVGIAFLIGFS